MKTRDSLLEKRGLKDANIHSNHLERQQQYLMSLNDQLNSYHCVPKTRKLYDEMELLKKRLRELGEENKELLQSDAVSSTATTGNLGQNMTQFKKTLDLEQAILEYIGKAKIHG
ncbi:MAG: hypothetical protein KJN75_02305 [Muriicola sp.]|nr:hypothetical protein [Muriicola sp.]